MLSSLITHRVHARHVLYAAAVYAPLAVAMFWWPGLVASVTRTCGLAPFDVRAFWNAQDARTMVEVCGSAGRTAYIQLQVADLVYPAALAALLLAVSTLLLRRFGGRTWPLLLPIVAMTLLDYAENAGIWTMLLQWPHVNTPIMEIAGMATAIKRVLGFIALSTPLVLGIVAAVHSGWQRTARSRHRVAGSGPPVLK